MPSRPLLSMMFVAAAGPTVLGFTVPWIFASTSPPHWFRMSIPCPVLNEMMLSVQIEAMNPWPWKLLVASVASSVVMLTPSRPLFVMVLPLEVELMTDSPLAVNWMPEAALPVIVLLMMLTLTTEDDPDGVSPGSMLMPLPPFALIRLDSMVMWLLPPASGICGSDWKLMPSET